MHHAKNFTVRSLSNSKTCMKVNLHICQRNNTDRNGAGATCCTKYISYISAIQSHISRCVPASTILQIFQCFIYVRQRRACSWSTKPPNKFFVSNHCRRFLLNLESTAFLRTKCSPHTVLFVCGFQWNTTFILPLFEVSYVSPAQVVLVINARRISSLYVWTFMLR